MNRLDQDVQRRYGSSLESPENLEDRFAQPSATPSQMGRLSVDAVINKTLGMFAILLLTAAASWSYIDVSPQVANLVILGSLATTIALAFIISFKRSISRGLILFYAALEGVFLGAASNVFEYQWPGIVMTAVVGTLAVFAAVLFGYKTNIIRVTSRSRRIFSTFLMGYMLFVVVNFAAAWIFGASEGWGLFGRESLFGLGISIFAVGLASYSLAVDFDDIEAATEAGLPEEYSWYLAFGLVVTLVWIYIELLRLLARLRR